MPKSLPQHQRLRLDSLERQILKELLDDARRPFQAIARDLGVDEKTVRNRVSKLRESGLLRFAPVLNPDLLDRCITAYIAINFSAENRHKPQDMAKQLASLPNVSWVGTVMGRYDILIEVVVDSWESLTQFQLTELPKIQGISNSEGFLILSQFGKRGVPFVPAILDDSNVI